MRKIILAVMSAIVSAPALATNGYFAEGYGMDAEGRGGTALAFASNAYGGANNPATMVFAGSRMDVGIDLFSPRRDASRSGFGPGLDGAVSSGSNYFLVPQFGYNRMAGERMSLGVSVYGNGGMNTNYPGGQFNCGQGPANMMCGVGSLGVDLAQLIIAPTAAFRFAGDQSFGFAPLLAYQRFEAKGLQAFAGTPNFSSNPAAVTNNGYDSSTGAGVRVGYLARVTPQFSVGLAYSTKISMGKFAKYAGLFAERGGFDIPENYGVGFAYAPDSRFTLGLDVQRINYSKIASVGNPELAPAQLGSAGGPGFAWRDVTAIKVGVEYQATARWTIRGGYDHSSDPIDSNSVTFNILAPGVVASHLSMGFTRRYGAGGELTMAYMHAFRNSVSGPSVLPVFQGGMPFGNETISLSEDKLGIAWGRRL